MRVCYFDCMSGASGDMILGALVDAGAPLDALRGELRKLPLSGWEIEAAEVRRGAFRAKKVDVRFDAHAHPHGRTLGEILAIVRGGGLAAPLVERIERVFTRLVDAEARVHGSTREAVHLHDVGAVDAILDVTGAAVALALLGVDSVQFSPLPLGGGSVDGPHGRVPVPAPATAELLRGFPVVDTGVAAELVTPTGAAILTSLGAPGRMPAMRVSAVGYGAGSRELSGTPNVLRCFLGESEGPASGDTVVQLETAIDDMSPQLYEPVLERLFAAGALDVYLTPLVMKRGRPGTLLTALCPPQQADDLLRVLFEETTTLGVRFSDLRRAVLEREIVTLQTSLGALPFKVARLAGRVVSVTPEFSEVKRVAAERSLPVRQALDLARAEGRRLLTG